MIPDQLGLFDDSLPTEISDLGLEALQRKMPAKLKRVINTANEVMSALPERADFLHAVLCQVGMPRRRIIERSFERYSGAASIKLTAGELYQRGQWVPQPLPYGAHPRLVMVHISGVAVRSRSRVIPIGESMRDFLIALGIPPNGGKTGGYTMFKRQMQALAACRLQLGMSIGQLDRTITTQPSASTHGSLRTAGSGAYGRTKSSFPRSSTTPWSSMRSRSTIAPSPRSSIRLLPLTSTAGSLTGFAGSPSPPASR